MKFDAKEINGIRRQKSGGQREVTVEVGFRLACQPVLAQSTKPRYRLIMGEVDDARQIESGPNVQRAAPGAFKRSPSLLPSLASGGKPGSVRAKLTLVRSTSLPALWLKD